MNNWISNEVELPFAGRLVWVKWYSVLNPNQVMVWYGKRRLYNGEILWKVVDPKSFETNCLVDKQVIAWMPIEIPEP